jgi:hypothetical protein
MTTTIADSISQARLAFPVQKVLESQHWPGLHRVTSQIYHLFRPGQSPRRLIVQNPFRWYDSVDGKVADALDLLSLLRGLTPDSESVIQEFLTLPGLPIPLTECVGDDSGSSQIAPENVGKSKDPLQETTDCSANSGAEIDGKVGDRALNTFPLVTKRKTPGNLLALIPSGEPNLQSDLFNAARAAGINEKYARRFLKTLIAEKQVTVRKIPRLKAKSALGYVREPSEKLE